MSNVVDWNSIGNQKGGSKSDDVVFLTSKSLPQTLLPSNEVVLYESVFDQETNRSRPPKDGEKARNQFLFYGLFVDEEGEKVIKICNCGTAVAKGIAQVQKSLQNLGLLSFVKVTSTGSGLNTEYEVEAVKVVDKPIPTDIWDKLKQDDKFKKLPGLEEIKDKLLGINTTDDSQEGENEETTAEAVVNDTKASDVLDI